jgi:putative Holliday junction resolvase
MMTNKRILGLDYGTKNVGLAYSDELGITVQPLESVPNRSRKDLLRRLRTLVELHDIGRIVVGLPLNMNGTAGPAAERVRLFMQQLEPELGIPLSEVDERLSTLEASEIWLEMSSRRQRRYKTVDSLAAALILERYLKEC